MTVYDYMGENVMPVYDYKDENVMPVYDYKDSPRQRECISLLE